MKDTDRSARRGVPHLDALFRAGGDEPFAVTAHGNREDCIWIQSSFDIGIPLALERADALARGQFPQIGASAVVSRDEPFVIRTHGHGSDSFTRILKRTDRLACRQVP